MLWAIFTAIAPGESECWTKSVREGRRRGGGGRKHYLSSHPPKTNPETGRGDALLLCLPHVIVGSGGKEGLMRCAQEGRERKKALVGLEKENEFVFLPCVCVWEGEALSVAPFRGGKKQ